MYRTVMIISVLIGVTYAGVTIAPLPYSETNQEPINQEEVQHKNIKTTEETIVLPHSTTKQEPLNQEEVQHENINTETTEETVVNDVQNNNNDASRVYEYREDNDVLSEHDTNVISFPCAYFIKDVINIFSRSLLRQGVSTNLLFVILFPVLIASVCVHSSICFVWANQMNLTFPPDFDRLTLTHDNLHLLAEIVSKAVDTFSVMQVEWSSQ